MKIKEIIKNFIRKVQFSKWLSENEESLRSRGVRIYSALYFSVLLKKEPKQKIINSILGKLPHFLPNYINTNERRFN